MEQSVKEKKLIIIRGAPGSGKSTKAQKIMSSLVNETVKHVEADMFFIGEDGVYRFDKERIKDAHAWCQQVTADSLMTHDLVIVSNTFTRVWEIIPYVEIAASFGNIGINCALLISECFDRYDNVHGVPKVKVEQMIQNYEHLNDDIYARFANIMESKKCLVN